MKKTERMKIKTKDMSLISRVIYIVGSFALLDIWLRVTTRWIGQYSIYELAPNLFTLCWSLLFGVIVTNLIKGKVRCIIYGVFYFVCTTYAIVQYGAYLILGKFLYISDFAYAGEGIDYISYIVEILDLNFAIQIIGLIVVGIVGIRLLKFDELGRLPQLFNIIIVILCIAGLYFIPNLYGEKQNSWDNFVNPAYEYEQFSNSNYDLELTGMYQYIARDFFLKIEKENKDYDEAYEMIDEYFANKVMHSTNQYTGIFQDKNVIVVMMESLDDWVITEEDTPTITYMLENGINFDEMYTPGYSSGYTFNTEFAFNTSVYPYSNGNVAYSLTSNTFSKSIANIFFENGYAVNSFHSGQRTFYNRGSMHETFGYQKYHSYYDYNDAEILMHDDSFLTSSEALFADLISEAPFFSYVITYSPHLPYTQDDELSQYVLQKYPEYAEGEITEEKILRAKAKLTDDMFRALLQRLEAEGILDDTVIIGFADHYAYGIDDKKFLQQASEEAGNSILENTPAFIYCSKLDEPLLVDKVMQTTDLAPTILNLFGLEVPHEIMGSDVFDEQYEGYAIFSGNTWITKQAYVKNGVLVWSNGMTDEDIFEMNDFVMKTHEINDSILNSDYYKYLLNK